MISEDPQVQVDVPFITDNLISPQRIPRSRSRTRKNFHNNLSISADKSILLFSTEIPLKKVTTQWKRGRDDLTDPLINRLTLNILHIVLGMSEGYSPLEVCLACGLAGRSQFHFGGSSCTACASFFRRTVSLNIRFVCKRDRACISSPALRSICRACRYECCVSKAGMNRDLVQQRRNQTRIPKYVLNSRKDGSSEIIRDYTTNSYTTLHEFSKPDKPGFSKILNISDMGLLEFYVKQVAVGKMEKNPLNITSASELLEIALSHQDLALESCTTCPGTDLLDQKDIEILFRYCSFSITWMDSIWEEASKENCLEASLEGKGEEDSLPCFISHLKSTLIPSFSRLQLNIFEFAALKSFCIWKLGVHDSSISMKVVAQEQYVSVTSALRKYYESSTTMESFEIATRIAEITLQIGPIFGAYREMLRVYEGLGISLSMPISEN